MYGIDVRGFKSGAESEGIVELAYPLKLFIEDRDNAWTMLQ